MSTDNHSSTSKYATITLVIVGILIVIGIVVSKSNMINSEVVQLKVDKTILEMDPLKGKYVGVNKEQILQVTTDGVRAYGLDGQEIWSDTLTLESIWVEQREPYFTVGSKNGRKVSIFSDKGKQGEIVTQNPIIYISISENGEIALIEETKEGHQVSAYNSKGELIASRVSYITSGIFPMTAEVTPDGKMLLVSYLGVSGTKIISTIEAIGLEKTETAKIDNIVYAVQQQDNLIYEVEFINDTEWVAVGDKYITFYRIDSEKIKTIPNLYITYNPYLNRRASIGGYFPIVATDLSNGKSIHAREALYLFNKQGEEIKVIPFENTVTYFYADSKGVIVGEGNKYKGYNKLGNQYFEYQASQDISKLVYINNEAIAISKDKVMLLKPKRNK